jgi:flagellar biosynthesis/type III secretory pathway M-ring protein FliF/YscJ
VLPGEAPPPEPAAAGERGKKSKKKKNQEEVEEFDVSDAPIGEAEVTEHLLVGREVDESTLRSQKLVEQVAELIKQDPNTTVSVLQRWIDAERK